MGNILYAIVMVLIIIWAVGVIGYQTGGIIHLLLVIALLILIIRLVQGKKIL